MVYVDVSNASHPYFTGKQKFVDTMGRVEKFKLEVWWELPIRPKENEVTVAVRCLTLMMNSQNAGFRDLSQHFSRAV